MPIVVTSPVGCPRFSVSQAVSSGLCPSTCVVPSRSVSSDLDTLTPVFELYVRLRERRHWDSDSSVRARRTFLGRRPVRSRIVAVQGQHLQQCSVASLSTSFSCTSGLRPVRGRRTQIKFVISLTGLDEAFRHSWYQSKKFEMADRRDWGGGGDDPEENTQRMIERIWESLTDIRMRMDQQAPVPSVTVPPGDGETIPVVPVPPPSGVEVPFVAPLPPPPPVLVAEEPVMQVENFLRLQPPTYSGGPNPDTAEHWVHEIERVFTTIRCPAADRVVLAAYQLRGFALEWWRLKMQTTFAGRTEETITWPEFLNVFNDTFFPIQVQQVKREQFRTLQQGHLISNCPYPREYGYGRGVQQQQQQQPQQFQQPQAGRGRGAPQQRGRGRVMAITRAQAEASNMIEARVLFDSGASHSFISEEFLDCMVHPLKEESCELVVEVPSAFVSSVATSEGDLLAVVAPPFGTPVVALDASVTIPSAVRPTTEP
ncbi:hypothetical protein Taro_050117 [Colocasia esculenta]|uniref:Retrotransposon gag domain-containing protein n=1 Tax=Colocasia esculenta TaxID=4460 RepID=A0A843XCK7_COLES|nr:hypothetical protein [Colocasia esculenta]